MRVNHTPAQHKANQRLRNDALSASIAEDKRKPVETPIPYKYTSLCPVEEFGQCHKHPGSTQQSESTGL